MDVFLTSLYSKVIKLLGYFVGLTYWKLLLIALCTIFSIGFANPYYNRYLNSKDFYNDFSGDRSVFRAIYEQSQHPLTSIKADKQTHQAKKVFRLVAPLFVKALPLSNIRLKLVLLFVFQQILGILSFYFILQILLKISNDPIYAAIGTLGTSFLYFGNSFFWDTYGWFDGIAFFGIVLALYLVTVQRSYLLFLPLTLAFWTDERALSASLILIIWDPLLLKTNNKKQTIKSLISSVSTLTYVISIIGYIAVRLYLTHVYGLATPVGNENLVGPAVILENLKRFPFNILNLYKAFWALAFIGGIWSFKGKNPTIYYLFILQFLIVIVGGMCVTDFTRSLTYSFPSLLALILLLAKEYRTDQARATLLVLVLFSAFYPTLFYIGNDFFLVSNTNLFFGL